MPRTPPTSTACCRIRRCCASASARARRPAASIPRELATDYEPPAADALAGARRRTIALVERELDDEPNMLTMRELALAGDDDDRAARHGRPTVSETPATASSPPTSRTRRRSSPCSAGRGLAADQPHRRHPPDPPPPRPVPGPGATPDPLRDPGRRDRRPRPRRDRHARTRPRRRARPRDRRQRARPQGHRPRQPQRARRDRRPLHDLQRPLHVPLPHPRARGPRHDAALRRRCRPSSCPSERQPGSAPTSWLRELMSSLENTLRRW